MSADQTQQQQQQQPEVLESPTKMSKNKAHDGADLAIAAADLSQRLLARTQKAIAARALQDSALPCTPMSPSGVEQEESKQATAATTCESPWYQGNRKGIPTFLGLAGDGTFEAKMNKNLKGLSLNKVPLTYEVADELSSMIGKHGCQFQFLDLAHAIDPQTAPALVDEKLQAVKAELVEQFPNVGGEDGNEETIAALTSALEKYKQEFTDYDGAIDFLARKKLDRFVRLFEGLEKNSSIQELDLSFNNLGAPNAEGRSDFAVVRKFAKVVDGNANLARLNVRGNPLGPIGCGLLAKAMCKNIAIHTLDMGGCDIVGEPNDEEDDNDQEEEDPVFGELYQGLEAISELFKKNKFLRCLALRNNRIKSEIELDGDDDGADTQLGKLLEPLKKFHRIEILDLGGNELGAGGAKMLQASLSLNKSLKVLDISDNEIGPTGLKFISNLVRTSKSIDTLVLQQNGLAGNGKTKKAKREALAAANDFGAALGGSKRIKHLNISSNHFGPELSAAVLTGLGSSVVEELNFSMNDLCGANAAEYDDSALRVLVSAMSECPLKKLSLSGNFLQAAGLALLVSGTPATEVLNEDTPAEGEEAAAAAEQQDEAAGPSPLEQLQSLDVSRNSIDDAAAAPLLGHLACNDAHLVELDLSYNLLADSKAIGDAVAQNETVRNLNLAHNLLGNSSLEDFRHFADGIVDRPSVSELNLAHNLLPDSHGAALSYMCRTATKPLVAVNALENPMITLETTAKLIAALQTNKSLRSCYVSSQQGDRTELVKTLQETLAENSTLTDVEFSFPLNDLEPEIVEAVQHSLLNNALAL